MFLKNCFQSFSGLVLKTLRPTVSSAQHCFSTRSVLALVSRVNQPWGSVTGCSGLHTGPALFKNNDGMHKEPKEWPKYNEILYPPQQPGESRRPAEVVHFRANIKYSTKKLWYISCMIRGMSVDEAIKQLSFYKRKGAATVIEVIKEAQEMAVRDHNVEYKSNLWIEDSFVRKAKTVYGLRRHAKQRFGTIHYRYTHYFLRLREGRPPQHYHPPRPTGNEMIEGYLDHLRQRRIFGAL